MTRTSATTSDFHIELRSRNLAAGLVEVVIPLQKPGIDDEKCFDASIPGATEISPFPGGEDLRSNTWSGWAEIENDPLIFSTLLEEWGVKAVAVAEIVPLDALFDLAPDNVYGLIFLSRWSSDVNDDATGKQVSTDLWFANQTSTFSCATIALMNIINNRPEVDLGPILERFRETTRTLTPLARGLELDRFEHVRNVHNSFATEIDKLIVDLRLKQDAQAAKGSTKKPRKRKRGRKSKCAMDPDEEEQTMDDEEDDNGFHFVAYVPVGQYVWRMDGLERSPCCLGHFDSGDYWTATALIDLQRQIESATADQLEFSLLSLGPASEKAVATSEREKMDRTREDWGPFISHMIRLHADKGDLATMMGQT